MSDLPTSTSPDPAAPSDAASPVSRGATSSPADRAAEIARDDFALGLVPTLAVVAVATAVLAGLLAPGWIGVGADRAVQRWRLVASFAPMATGLLAVSSTLALVFSTVASTRAAMSARLFAVFGGGLVVSVAAAALHGSLDSTPIAAMAAGTLIATATGAASAARPRETRALALAVGLIGVTSLLHMSAWGFQALAVKRASIGWMHVATAGATCALVTEFLAVIASIVFVVHRPGVRPSIAVGVAIAAAFGVAAWTLGVTAQEHGGLRDVLQRSLSLRLQGGGPLPAWIDPAVAAREFTMLEPRERLALLPMVLVECLSMALPIAYVASARAGTLALLATFALAIVSRGQVDVPMRALELCVAGLATLALARMGPSPLSER